MDVSKWMTLVASIRERMNVLYTQKYKCLFIHWQLKGQAIAEIADSVQ